MPAGSAVSDRSLSGRAARRITLRRRTPDSVDTEGTRQYTFDSGHTVRLSEQATLVTPTNWDWRRAEAARSIRKTL